MNGTDARMPRERFHVAIEAVGVKHSGGAHVLRRLVDTLLAREEIRAGSRVPSVSERAAGAARLATR